MLQTFLVGFAIVETEQYLWFVKRMNQTIFPEPTATFTAAWFINHTSTTTTGKLCRTAGGVPRKIPSLTKKKDTNNCKNIYNNSDF